MTAMAAQMITIMKAWAPTFLDNRIAVAPTPRAIDPRAVMVVATCGPTGAGRAGGGPTWYPGGNMGPR